MKIISLFHKKDRTENIYKTEFCFQIAVYTVLHVQCTLYIVFLSEIYFLCLGERVCTNSRTIKPSNQCSSKRAHQQKWSHQIYYTFSFFLGTYIFLFFALVSFKSKIYCHLYLPNVYFSILLERKNTNVSHNLRNWVSSVWPSACSTTWSALLKIFLKCSVWNFRIF